MPELKLPKLPDRMPVKITITVDPELNRSLCAYAAAYRETYGGDGESVAELVPYMLRSFIDGDRSFAKARKEAGLDNASTESIPAARPIRRRRQKGSESTSSQVTE